jgi:hypothetical protein
MPTGQKRDDAGTRPEPRDEDARTDVGPIDGPVPIDAKGPEAGPPAPPDAGSETGPPDARAEAGTNHDAGVPADSGAHVDAAPPPPSDGGALVSTNFDVNGKPVPRLDVNGKQLDAHAGHLAYWNGTYYLYGDTYGCGFAWKQPNAPFCGFRVYTSPDLVAWTDRGTLFDATTDTWQKRCNGNTYGCFRPKVVLNASTHQYVLWFNSYDNVFGYHVLESDNPIGPFTEIGEPKLAVNANAMPAGLNDGDENLFVDADGKAYLAYTDWVKNGDVVVEELDAAYHNGTGRYGRLGQSSTEAPALFRRNDLYYVTYSDPNCGYCAGTGTSYKTAPSPLGPWSTGAKISASSCGGQPSHVSVLPGRSGTVYVFQSDLWLNGNPSETYANQFWGPLSFDATGKIQNIVCAPTVVLN